MHAISDFAPFLIPVCLSSGVNFPILGLGIQLLQAKWTM